MTLGARPRVNWIGSGALLFALLVIATSSSAQTLPLRVEYRGAAVGDANAAPVVDAAAGVGLTLVFRVVNPADVARTATAGVEVPAGWQVLFASERLELAAVAALIETVTIVAPRGAAAGDYTVRYEATPTASEGPVAAAAVTVRIGERRQLALSWLSPAAYLPAGEAGTFELEIVNGGNVTETVTLMVKSILGVPLQMSWTRGVIDAGDTQMVRVVRAPRRTREAVHDTLTATVLADRMTTSTEASVGLDIVPEGRAVEVARSQLPTAVTLRTGSRRNPGFGSFVGGGTLGAGGSMMLNFGFLSRERSHPLMFEADRNYLNFKAPGVDLAFGDQTWSLSYLTEGGHYGLGAGGRVERGRWSGGAFVDTGRYDVPEGSQAGGFIGVRAGRAIALSVQYLGRFADSLQSDRVADIGSVRLVAKLHENVTGDFEVGAGRSATGTGKAASGQITFSSRRVSFYGRRVRRDDAYPIRDRTGLIDGAGLSLRPFGQLQFEATFDGTGQVEDPTLPINAPTQQRISRGTVSWGSFARVSAGRIEWTSPGRNWTAEWRRESATAELHLPFGPVWIAPGVEQGTEATPSEAKTPYSLSWLHAGVQIGRGSSVNVRGEYGRGAAGDANKPIRRLSFGATLQPTEATRLTLQVQNSADDALWLQGSRSDTAMLDQRLPWRRHHIIATYQRRSGGTIYRRDGEAYRLDYVVPIGIPIRSASDPGRVTVRLRDAESGLAQARMLVQIDGRSRLTDPNGVVAFTGLTPGEYHVTVAPGSLGSGRTVVPALPIRVIVRAGGRIEVNATIVRTARVLGTIRVFQPASGGLFQLPGQEMALVPTAGVAGALIDLIVNDEHRTAVTDRQGRFVFDDVPPGQWPLRVVRADVPAFFRLEETQTTVALEPGQTREIEFRVVPKPQVVDTGEAANGDGAVVSGPAVSGGGR